MLVQTILGFLVVGLAVSALSTSRVHSAPSPQSRASLADWPDGTRVLEFENLEGVILVGGRLYGKSGRDTSGVFALDTGAGYFALDHDLAVRFGIAERGSNEQAIEFANGAAHRLELGSMQLDQVAPVLTLDLDVVRRVTDRPVLGLLGERLFSNDALWIDYQAGVVALIPVNAEASAQATDSLRESRTGAARQPSIEMASGIAVSRAALGAILPAKSVGIPFELEGDGKIVVQARLSNPRPPRYSPWLNLIVDTGATKCVLFADPLEQSVPMASSWRAMEGLAVPTLIGTSDSRVVRIPSLQVSAGLQKLEAADVDAAIIETELSALLSRVVGRPVQGLLGYSFLKRYRIVIDYPHRVLWLDPLDPGWEDRPYEYSNVGLQLERSDGAVRVLGIVAGSPAASAGIAAGDELVAIDRDPTEGIDIAALSRRLEGPPGTRVRLTLRRGSVQKTYSLSRRRLL